MGHQRPVASSADRIPLGIAPKLLEGLFGEVGCDWEFAELVTQIAILLFDVYFNAQSRLVANHFVGHPT